MIKLSLSKYNLHIVIFSSTLTIFTIISGRILDMITVFVLVFSLFVTIYIVPKMSTYESFLYVLSIAAASVAVVGILPLFTGEFNVGVFHVRFHDGTPITIPMTDLTVSKIRSVFGNPNGFAHFVAPGSLAAYILYLQHKDKKYILLFLCSSLGLLLSGSRAGQMFLLIGTGITTLAILMRKIGKTLPLNHIIKMVFWGILSVLLVFFVAGTEVSRVIPIDLTGRLYLWNATVEVIKTNPIVGIGYGINNPGDEIAHLVPDHLQGLSPHNSYLRISLQAGVIGGLSYILFQYHIVKSVDIDKDRLKITSMVSFALAFAVTQMFEVYSLIGYAPHSIIAALVIGYCLKNTTDSSTVT